MMIEFVLWVWAWQTVVCVYERFHSLKIIFLYSLTLYLFIRCSKCVAHKPPTAEPSASLSLPHTAWCKHTAVKKNNKSFIDTSRWSYLLSELCLLILTYHIIKACLDSHCLVFTFIYPPWGFIVSSVLKVLMAWKYQDMIFCRYSMCEASLSLIKRKRLACCCWFIVLWAWLCSALPRPPCEMISIQKHRMLLF